MFFCVDFDCLGSGVSVRRSSLGLKVALVMLHLVYAGILFAFDRHLIEEAKIKPWYVFILSCSESSKFENNKTWLNFC